MSTQNDPKNPFSNPVVKAYTAIDWKLRGWAKQNEEARKKAADPSMSLSSFVIDELIVAGSREDMTRYLTRAKATLSSYLTFDPADVEQKCPMGVHDDEDEALGYIAKLVDTLTDQFMEWYKPNSTSNTDVEIKLSQHLAMKEAIAALKGKSY